MRDILVSKYCPTYIYLLQVRSRYVFKKVMVIENHNKVFHQLAHSFFILPRLIFGWIYLHLLHFTKRLYLLSGCLQCSMDSSEIPENTNETVY